MNKFFTSLAALSLALSAAAVPALRRPHLATMADGTTVTVTRFGDENFHYALDSDNNLLIATSEGYRFATINEAGQLEATEAPTPFTTELRARAAKARTASNARRRVPGHVGQFPGTSFPSTGKQKALVLLVDFPDRKFNLGDKANQYFTDMLNKTGFSEYGGTGCAREYFLEQSSNKFDCDFDVFGPVTMKYDADYYGANDVSGNDKYAHKIVIEGCNQLDDQIDFTQYDRDGDGSIDNVFVFYAGLGEATTDDPNLIWPHAYYVTQCESKRYTYDGVLLDGYGCTNEWVNSRPDGVGTFVHEFSHILGLPDLYMTSESEMTKDTDYYLTPGSWNVLDYGPYNNNGCTPPSYSAFERNAMGWLTPQELTADITTGQLSDIQTSNHCYSITNPANPNEFYLLEARVRTGWDKYLPGQGMLCWHVDFNDYRWSQNSVNNKPTHQYVDLIEADGIAVKRDRTAADCFPGTKRVTTLTPKWWNSTATGVSLSNITFDSAADVNVTFANNTTAPTPGGGESNSPDDAITVADVIAAPMDGSEVNVAGYVVGWVNSSWSEKNVKFNTTGATNTNLVLADTPTETVYTRCIPVQLYKQTAARNELNLKDNPSMLGKKVVLTGTLETYFSVPGLKNVKTYSMATTSISELTTSTEMDGEIFDLQGRRLQSKPARGLYISNGRVQMAR